MSPSDWLPPGTATLRPSMAISGAHMASGAMNTTAVCRCAMRHPRFPLAGRPRGPRRLGTEAEIRGREVVVLDRFLDALDDGGGVLLAQRFGLGHQRGNLLVQLGKVRGQRQLGFGTGASVDAEWPPAGPKR